MRTVTRSPYSREEFARRGDEVYEREVLPRLRQEDKGKMVTIDIETGAFEIDEDEIVATHRLLARHPNALIWFREAGSRYAHRFGPRPRAGKPL